MRIGIDLTPSWRPRTGANSYAIELVLRLLNYDSVNEYVLYFGPELHPLLADYKRRFTPRIFKTKSELLCKYVFLPFWAKRDRLDVMHFPIFPPALLQNGCNVLTILDATPWLFPETMSIKGRLYFKWMTKISLKKLSGIVTISNTARKDIAKALELPEERIEPIYLGIRHGIACARDIKKNLFIRSKYKLPENYILSVGTIEPRKNYETAILAFERVAHAKKCLELSWVIVGRKGWDYYRFIRKVQSSSLRSKIIMLGHVPDEELDSIYQMARLLLYPSLYEGFGLPPIEAMASGCPVIASSCSALSEVIGDAGILVDPLDPTKNAEAIEKILFEQNVRDRLIKAGYERAALYNWEKTAAKTIRVYEKAYRRYARAGYHINKSEY